MKTEEEKKTFIKPNNNNENNNIKLPGLTSEEQIIICQFCNRKIFTNTNKTLSWHGILISLILFLLLKLYAIPLIIIVLLVTVNVEHNCSNCLNKLGTYSNFDSFSLEDRVFAFKFLSFGVIITKKHFLAVFSFLLSGILIFLYIKSAEVSIIKDDEINLIKFEDFQEMFKTNKTLFWDKFYLRTFNWKGFVIQVKMLNSFLAKFQNEIMVKINSESNTNEPDVFFYVEKEYYQDNKVKITNITTGDEIEFNVTLQSRENFFGIRQPVLVVKNIRKTGGKMYIPHYVNEEGRYGLKGTRLEKAYEEAKMLEGENRKKLK